MDTLKIGDRIRLINMPDDPNPIPVGSEGTVTSVNQYTIIAKQVSVKWDSGRMLMLLPGIDTYEVIGHE